MRSFVSMFLVLTIVAATAAGASAAVVTRSFAQLVDAYFDAYFALNPSAATWAGIHDHDAELEDYSAAGFAAQVANYRRFGVLFAEVDAARLDAQQRSDLDLIRATIASQLFELTEVRSWQRNADTYSSGVNQSIYAVMKREFAPAADRLRLVIARERRIPAALDAAKANLVNPPKVFTEIALEQLPGIESFFATDVGAAFKSVADPKLQAEFAAVNARAVAALKGYEAWMKSDLLPRSHGDFRLGRERYLRKLHLDEMVDVPLDRLLEIGIADLRRNQRWFAETAHRIDPKRTPAQILEQAGREHPAPDKLLETFRGMLGGLQQFIVKQHLLTLPSLAMPIIQETPPFERALTFASMDTPGAFETRAKEAYFNVTLPEKGWPAQKVAEHMEAFNFGTINSTAIHEALPGHYIQFLYLPNAPSKARKLLGCGSNAEGWAHYVEQMVLDEGFGGADLKLRLGQLQDALLRNARFVVGIRMHCGEMTFEQAIDFFVKEGYMSRTNAEREAKRGTSDPTYCVYTLGKLAILKLRDDVRRVQGAGFSLQRFHDAFLHEGTPPLRLVRRALLGTDGSLF